MVIDILKIQKIRKHISNRKSNFYIYFYFKNYTIKCKIQNERNYFEKIKQNFQELPRFYLLDSTKIRIEIEIKIFRVGRYVKILPYNYYIKKIQ